MPSRAQSHDEANMGNTTKEKRVSRSKSRQAKREAMFQVNKKIEGESVGPAACRENCRDVQK